MVSHRIVIGDLWQMTKMDSAAMLVVIWFPFVVQRSRVIPAHPSALRNKVDEEDGPPDASVAALLPMDQKSLDALSQQRS